MASTLLTSAEPIAVLASLRSAGLSRAAAVVRAMLCGGVMAAAMSAPALAGPPYQTDDPEPTAYRNYEIYVYTTYENDGRDGTSENLPSLEVNYGLMPNVQFSLTFPFVGAQPAAVPARGGTSAPAGGASGASSNGGAFSPGAPLGSPWHGGYGDTEIALKVRFVQEGAGRPQIAFYPAIDLPTGGAAFGEALPKTFLPLWAQKTNGSWTYFGGGGVWHNPGLGNRDYAFSGFAATREVRDGLSIGGEIYHQTADTIGGTASTGVGIGFEQVRGEHHALLASFGRGIAGKDSFYGYAAYQLYLGPRTSENASPSR